MSWWRRLPVTALGILILVGAVRGETGDDVPPEIRAERGACDACGLDEAGSCIWPGENGVDAEAHALHEQNLLVFQETDSLYRSGAFGEPGSEEARDGALVHFQLRSVSGITYIQKIAGQDMGGTCVTEADLRQAYGETYGNFGIYPIKFLVRGLAGRGGFCMEYDLSGKFDGTVRMGGEDVEAKIDWLETGDGSGAPAFRLRMPSQEHKTIDLLFEPRICGRVWAETIVDRGDTLRLEILDDLQGMYVRKAGTHRLGALIFWRSVVEGDEIVENPRLGACAYFPEIKLKLPVFLPDLGLDDLRDFEFPLPLAHVSWFDPAEESAADWLQRRPGGFAEPWPSRGPRPEMLKEAFPDL